MTNAWIFCHACGYTIAGQDAKPFPVCAVYSDEPDETTPITAWFCKKCHDTVSNPPEKSNGE